MQSSTGLGIHEKAELHEMLMFKTNCLNKARMMQNQVQDTELQQLLTQDIQSSTEDIAQLEQLLQR
ncbi:similar to spore coat protein [Alteribacillus persepolensis]|uniref:Similar to spore coat protein n=1 Tax=Alteribacillus persepolensis TaxID=568899 RepID=A0A1G8BZ81_9BACI|nr:spore coat protein [Alteribacillus persepolensis]SDH38438.1 similar to spore coat protein [Alteribacillus persepolensis]